ncbi:MAG TPA: glycosyl hydrolase family 79 C-terminal domain-containing protein [Solirubrobacteraceae bacterium]|nr:glycosyl hydrolase family 79 C-terminal domain-containing protein [Solirubrobacteraceae bacterium]
MRRSVLALAAAGLLAGAAPMPAQASAAAPPEAVPGQAARAASAYPFALTVTKRTVTRPLPASFLGLALEYGTVPEWISQDGHPNPILPVLLRNLDPAGRPSVRIGGQSADRSWWPVAGMRRPVGVTQSLGPSWIGSARMLVRETGAQLLLGINLEAGSAELARAEADRLVSGLGARNIDALELGNEPDLYRDIPWFRVEGDHLLPWYAKTGAPAYARAPGWGPSAYAAQVAGVAARLPRLPLAGPDTVPGPWTAAFAGLRHSRVRMLASHAYGLNQCVTDPALPGYPSIAHLLSLHASRGMFLGIPRTLALAHRLGLSDRIDEMGSVTCNGRSGVSNTFASALWAMDALFQAARIGLDGVNLHTYPHSSNGLFDFSYSPSTHEWRAIIHPLYDGALMFAEAAPPGSRLLHTVSSDQARLRAWATLGADGRIRILLINDSTGQAARVLIRAPAGYRSSTASVQWLRAPSAAATGEVTIGGRRFGATRTGVPPAPRLDALPIDGAAATLTVPPVSAALITVPPAAIAELSRWLALADPATSLALVDPTSARGSAVGYSCQSVSIQAICLRSSLPTVSTW